MLPDGFEVALQVAVCVGATCEEAERRFDSSQLAAHLRSLSGSTLKDQKGGGFAERNLIGTVEDVGEQIDAYAAAGVTTMAGLLFAANTVSETREMMEQFSTTVMPAHLHEQEPVR